MSSHPGDATISKSSAAYDILRGQILLQQCAIDALLAAYPRRGELADAFRATSTEFIKMITEKQGFEAEAIEVVKMTRLDPNTTLPRQHSARAPAAAMPMLRGSGTACVTQYD